MDNPRRRRPGKPRIPRVPAKPRKGSNHPKQGDLFARPEIRQTPAPASKPTEKQTEPRRQNPAVRITSIPVDQYGRRLVNWQIQSIEIPRTREENAQLREHLKRIIQTAKSRGIHHINYMQDANSGAVADLLRELGFQAKADTSGGHTREDTYYIFSLHVR